MNYLRMKRILIFIFVIITQIGFGQERFPFEYLQQMDYFDAYMILKNKENDYIGDKYENQYWQGLVCIVFLGSKDKAKECFKIRDSIFNKPPSKEYSLNHKKIKLFINKIILYSYSNLYLRTSK